MQRPLLGSTGDEIFLPGPKPWPASYVAWTGHIGLSRYLGQERAQGMKNSRNRCPTKSQVPKNDFLPLWVFNRRSFNALPLSYNVSTGWMHRSPRDQYDSFRIAVTTRDRVKKNFIVVKYRTSPICSLRQFQMYTKVWNGRTNHTGLCLRFASCAEYRC